MKDQAKNLIIWLVTCKTSALSRSAQLQHLLHPLSARIHSSLVDYDLPFDVFSYPSSMMTHTEIQH